MTNSQGHHYDADFGDIPIILLGLGGCQLEVNDGEIPTASRCSSWAPTVTAVSWPRVLAMPGAAHTLPGELQGLATPEPGFLF